MLTHELAIELTRIRIQQADERATLMSRVGALPSPEPFFSFRRRVISLPGTVEVRPAPSVTALSSRSAMGDEQRIARRLAAMSVGDRKAS